MSKKIKLYRELMCEWEYDREDKCKNGCGLPFEMHAQPHEIKLRDKINEIIRAVNND